MKNFNDYIFERVVLRARKDMPQIADSVKFMEDLKKNGIKSTVKKINPKILKPTQNEFNDEKIKGMIQAKKYNLKSIFVTSDKYILDGHHRWKAHLELDEEQSVIQVNMTFEELFDFVDGKPYIKYKKLHEAFNSNSSMSSYMTDDKQRKVDELFDSLFTNEMFQKVYDSVKNKKITEDGEGGGDSGVSVNSVTGVEMPPTGINTYRRKNTDHKYI